MDNLLKFDTLNKKPKLYNMLVPAAVAAVVLGLIGSGVAEEYRSLMGVVLCLSCAVMLVQLIRAFFRQIRYNPYSYNTIYYCGFSLFLFFILVTYTVITVKTVTDPDSVRGISLVFQLLNSARQYMLITFPFILAFSIALCVSNIELIRHERRRLVNLLGIILSVLLIAGEVFIYRFDYYVSGSLRQIMIHEFVSNTFAAIYLYCECMLIGTIAAGAIAARYEPEPDKDYLIILGCGLRRDGTPTPLLRGRLDRALAFYKKQKEETGKELTFVTSGGQGPDEAVSESAAMKRYLTENGIPEERIIEEDRSTDTLENMRFSKEKIKETGSGGKVAFSTTNYHVFRAGLCARRVKMRAVGMGAGTKWYFWPNAAVREFVGLLTEHRVKQAVILGCLILSHVVLTILAYGTD